jgi:uncharacterized LabA/DUF88 family protein
MIQKPKIKYKLKAEHPSEEPLELAPLQFIVYIDGYNLYKAINHEEPPNLLRLGWCNYQKLGERLVEMSFKHSTAARIVTVKYFSAPVEGNYKVGEKVRQELWLSALKTEAPELQVTLGAHTGPRDSRKEKMTDVNIGIAIANDLTRIRPAGIVLVSGDRDFLPAVELAAQQGVPVAIFFPQDHPQYNLRLGADYTNRVLRTYLSRDVMEPHRLRDQRWRDYLVSKIADQPKFRPSLDYEDDLHRSKTQNPKIVKGTRP